MKLPLIIAHGEDVIAFAFGLGVATLVISAGGMVASLRKKKDRVSIAGAICASVGILVGGLLWYAHGTTPPFFDGLSLVMLSPLPVAIATSILVLSERANRPNQSLEPMRFGVTSRADPVFQMIPSSKARLAPANRMAHL